MTALARGLVESGLDLGGVDKAGVLAFAERKRRGSYFDRMSSTMKSVRIPLAFVMADIPDGGLKKDETVALIRSCLDDDVTDIGTGPEGFFDHLVHYGALLESEDGRYTCPIPTFRDYLMKEGGLEPPVNEGGSGLDDGPS